MKPLIFPASRLSGSHHDARVASPIAPVKGEGQHETMRGGGERTSCLTGQQLVILYYRSRNLPDAEIARRRGMTLKALQKSMARAVVTIRLMQNDFITAGLEPDQLDRMLLPALN